jgi:phage-related protein
VEPELKPIRWLGPTLDDIREFPDAVRRTFGFALEQAQRGGKHPHAKPLQGFRGASVLQISDDFDTDTYRGIYTVRFRDVIYVLHVFKKKSKSGIGTPQGDIDLINTRLKQAEQDYR